MSEYEDATIDDFFPAGSRVLLTGGGQQFVERLGVEAVRQVVLHVMLGENIRTLTEPLSRQRLAQLSGALVVLFARGLLHRPDFTEQLSSLALSQIATARRNDNVSLWPAQWLIGLTSKSVQNVLRSNPEQTEQYIRDFEQAVAQAAAACRREMGDLRLTLGFAEDPSGRRVELGWQDIARLTTAIGSQTLTIRGSEKSIYGKLFERLILGSFLTILGFERVIPATNTKPAGVFWLSDSSNMRESDATLLLQPGKVANFDIGFIGPGNSEISKDKLSRYEREMEIAGSRHSSVTFIVVDRLPETSKTQKAAQRIGAEIIQMSMQYWPRDLAQRLGQRLGFAHELQAIPNSRMHDYLVEQLARIPIQNFVSGVNLQDVDAQPESLIAQDANTESMSDAQ